MSKSGAAAWHKDLTSQVNNVSLQRHLSINLISQTIEKGVPTARCEFVSNSRHLVPSGAVHGGISSLAIDSTAVFAVIPTLEAGQSSATIASSFQIVGSKRGEGKKYEVTSRMVKRGKNIAFCEGEVECEGVLIAKGTLTKIITQPVKEEKSKL